MNYWALIALGVDHPRISQELVEENKNNPGFWELPHFTRDLPENTSGEPASSGGWRSVGSVQVLGFPGRRRRLRAQVHPVVSPATSTMSQFESSGRRAYLPVGRVPLIKSRK